MTREEAIRAGLRGEATERQLQVLEAVRSYQRERGVPPAVRTLATLLGIRSSNAVLGHLKRLHRKGLLIRTTRGRGTVYAVPASSPEGPTCPCCGASLKPEGTARSSSS